MNRRSFIQSILAAATAPYVVTTAGVLMPVKKILTPRELFTIDYFKGFKPYLLTRLNEQYINPPIFIHDTLKLTYQDSLLRIGTRDKNLLVICNTDANRNVTVEGYEYDTVNEKTTVTRVVKRLR